MSKELEYNKVMEGYADRAEKQAILSNDPADAWIRVDPGQIWYPNPLYCGKPVKHPEEV